MPQGDVSRAGSRGFGELIWSSASLLLPSSGEMASQGPAGTVPPAIGIYLFSDFIQRNVGARISIAFQER